MTERIVNEALSWIGTPFWGHLCLKGIGVDCVWLAIGVYRAAGLITTDIRPPRYTLGAGSHLQSSLVIEAVLALGLFEKAQVPQPGDLVGFKLGLVIHHVGIVVTDKTFVHAYHGAGVVKSAFAASPWAKRLEAVWRPIQPMEGAGA